MGDAILKEQELLNLHARLLAGERADVAVICRALLDPLILYLRAKFPRVDDHLLQEAAGNALLDYTEHPEGYDPTVKAGLIEYVRLIAWRDASNFNRAEKRCKIRDRKVGEQLRKRGKSVAGDPWAGKWVEEEFEAYLKLLPDERDRTFMRLKSAGITDEHQLGSALGLNGLKPAELKKRIKNATDRIRVSLKRAGLRQ